ncbi:MAG TPA: hypothetical protein VK919_06700 [Solirubrobacterales bacterium]|nr:hypothetical protein [Solirubrobacterales bacterium]
MSEIAHRRIAALVLLAAIVVGVLAVAGGGPFEDDPPTESDRVAATVERLYGSAAAGDFETFCSLLTDRARATLRRNAAEITGDEVGCARALELTIGAGLDDSSVTVEDASVSGPRARVTARFRAPEARPELRTVYLEEIDGQWLVTDPG